MFHSKRVLSVILSLLLSLAMLLPLSGCASKSTEDHEPSSSVIPTESEEESQEESSGQGEESPEEGSEDMDDSDSETIKEAVRVLDCIKDQGLVESLLPLSDGRALVLTIQYLENDDKEQLFLVDLAKDEVLASRINETGAALLGQRPDGTIAAYDYNAHVLSILGEDLSVQDTFDLVCNEIIYSFEEDCFYAAKMGELSRVTLDGESEIIFSLQNGVRVEEIDARHQCCIISAPSVKEGVSVAYGIYSFGGDLLVYNEEDIGPYEFSGESLFARDYMYGFDEGRELPGAFRLYAADGTVSCYALPNDYSLQPIADSSYILGGINNYQSKDAEKAASIVLVRPETSLVYPVFDFTDFGNLVVSDTLWDGQFVAAFSTNDISKLLVIDPAVLEETKAPSMTLSSVDLPEVEETVLPDMPDYLGEAQAKAEALAERFHVTVLIGPMADRLGIDETYSITPTSDLGEAEVPEIMNTLTVLEEVLSKYPEGFFDRFLSFTGEGGLRFLLFKDMARTDASFIAGGVTWLSGAWINIALSLPMGDSAIIHHEMTHAVEDLLVMNDVWLNDDEWNSLNPEGFEYNNDLSNYRMQEDVLDYTLGVADQENVYFVSMYGAVDAQEDRATLIETVSYYGYDFIVSTYPHLQEKIAFMEKYLESFFGYVYWKEF